MMSYPPPAYLGFAKTECWRKQNECFANQGMYLGSQPLNAWLTPPLLPEPSLLPELSGEASG